MSSSEIRQSFFDFFKERGHRILPSAPVVPQGDPTLLFTNAGMNQFKDVFLGAGTRGYSRAADTQKCIRVSGKHNDLEEVGRDTYHHTFFEMLGNWSFGDYYKREAIAWAWELLTSVWNIPKERLYATVFRTDDESHALWLAETDIDRSHVLRFDEKDNFWEMGETGPCGPCSEIHIDLTADLSGGHLVNKGSPLVIELWNLVFIQHNRNPMGELEDLPQKHVDTGMGFERLCAILQGKKSNYDTDVFAPLLARIGALCGMQYERQQPDSIEQVSMRVMADHSRALAFAIADGAVPSNEDRGYVLRRILRRAARYARNLGLHEPALFKLVPVLAEQLGGVFPEVREKQAFIERIVNAEEESFNLTLDRGIELFNEIAQRAEESESPEITGDEVFKLYDTFGFPVDLIVLMAKEHGLEVDLEGFERLMEEQKERSRNAAKVSNAAITMGAAAGISTDATVIRGFQYNGPLDTDVTVDNAGGHWISLSKNIFYAESGGQVGDTGEIIIDDKRIPIIDTKKGEGNSLLIITGEAGNLLGKRAHAAVDAARRARIMRNHTATHLVHEALRRVLGTHLHQQGSLVAPDRLRFDFNHFEKITPQESRDIEQMVNEKIREGIIVETEEISIEEARKIPNVKMFFGDKYGDEVRVVTCDPNFSIEFCGGTHVKNTADIGYFKLIGESGIASGMRRIEAVTGAGADAILQFRYDEIERLSTRLNVTDRELYRKIEDILEEKKLLEKELAKYRRESAASAIDLGKAKDVGGIKLYAARIDVESLDALKSLGDTLRAKLGSGAGVLCSAAGEKVQFVCVATDDVAKKVPAGKLAGEFGKLLGGSGGGKPTMATGGGKNPSKINEALQRIETIVEHFLKA